MVNFTELLEGKKIVLIGSSFISMELAVLATNKKLESISVGTYLATSSNWTGSHLKLSFCHTYSRHGDGAV
jgi:hypothetical protein